MSSRLLRVLCAGATSSRSAPTSLFVSQGSSDLATTAWTISMRTYFSSLSSTVSSTTSRGLLWRTVALHGRHEGFGGPPPSSPLSPLLLRPLFAPSFQRYPPSPSRASTTTSSSLVSSSPHFTVSPATYARPFFARATAGATGSSTTSTTSTTTTLGNLRSYPHPHCYQSQQHRSVKTRGWMTRHVPKHPRPKKIKAKPPSTLKHRFLLVRDQDPDTGRTKPVLLHWAANRRHNNTKKSSRAHKALKGLRPLMNTKYTRRVVRLGFRGETLKHLIPQHKGEIDYLLEKLRTRGRADN